MSMGQMLVPLPLQHLLHSLAAGMCVCGCIISLHNRRKSLCIV